jgi:hypothetical protein
VAFSNARPKLKIGVMSGLATTRPKPRKPITSRKKTRLGWEVFLTTSLLPVTQYKFSGATRKTAPRELGFRYCCP